MATFSGLVLEPEIWRKQFEKKWSKIDSFRHNYLIMALSVLLQTWWYNQTCGSKDIKKEDPHLPKKNQIVKFIGFFEKINFRLKQCFLLEEQQEEILSHTRFPQKVERSSVFGPWKQGKVFFTLF